MKRAAILALLLASCAHQPHPSTHSDTEPTIEELDTSLEGTLQPSVAVDCDRAAQLRDAICTMAKRLCVSGESPRCDDGRTRCERAKTRVDKHCVVGAVDQR